MTDVREEVAKLWLAKKAAEDAYDDHPEGIRLVVDEDGCVTQVIARCGKTGVPLLQSDQVLECPETGNLFLRSALGLPLLPDTDDKEDLEEAA